MNNIKVETKTGEPLSNDILELRLIEVSMDRDSKYFKDCLARVRDVCQNWEFFKSHGYATGITQNEKDLINFKNDQELSEYVRGLIMNQYTAIENDRKMIKNMIEELGQKGLLRLAREVFGNCDKVSRDIAIVPVGPYAGMIDKDAPIGLRVNRTEEYPQLIDFMYSGILTDEWVIIHEAGAHLLSANLRQKTSIQEDVYEQHPLKEALMDVITAWYMIKMGYYDHFEEVPYFLQGTKYREQIIDIFCQRGSLNLNYPGDFEGVIKEVTAIIVS